MKRLRGIKDMNLSTYITNVTRMGMTIFLGVAAYTFLCSMIANLKGAGYGLETLFMPSIMVVVVGGILSFVLSFLTYPIYKAVLKSVAQRQ